MANNPGTQEFEIQEIMEESGVGFGTSGVRGLVTQMTDRVCYGYTKGFLQYLDQLPDNPRRIALAGDLRPSTQRIMQAAALAAEHHGYQVTNCGLIPTPAVTLHGLSHGMGTIMVTGSHIPDDRNGIKYSKPDGEILKEDEGEIIRQRVRINPALFDSDGALLDASPLPPPDPSAENQYLQRYLDFFPDQALRGMRLGIYTHSSVARELMPRIARGLGAGVMELGPSTTFVPVDTEAIHSRDIALGREWAERHQLDAIISTDGDGDRPLIGDERGEWFRGDIAGILCARYLDISHLVTPVSSNSAVEACNWFRQVIHTRIGSPYVVAEMIRLDNSGTTSIAGYEANGGFLIQDPVRHSGSTLTPLPTRDAMIVLFSLLCMAREQQIPLSQLRQLLPPRFTHSDRLRDLLPEQSSRLLTHLLPAETSLNHGALKALLGHQWGDVQHWDTTDGLRIYYESGDILHLRPSGNAPELRCYAESNNQNQAQEIVRLTLERLAQWNRS